MMPLRPAAQRARTSLAWIGLLVLSTPALAQAPSPGQLVPQSLAPQPRQTPTGVALPAPAESGAPAGAAAIRLRIGEIRVEGGSPELEAATQAVTAPLRGRTITVADAYAAAAAIEGAYAGRGFFLTRIVIPPQHARHGGTLVLRVVEGFIEAVDSSALPEAARARVEAVLGSAVIGQRRLTLATFERRLLLAGEVPGLSLHSTLIPGTGTGAVRLVLSGEHRRLSGEVSATNTLSRELGRASLSFNTSLNSMLGFGEQVYATAAGAPGGGWFAAHSPRRLFAAGLILPLGTDGLSFNLEGAYSTTKPRVLPDQLPTESEFSRLSARLSYPLLRSRTDTLVLRTSFDMIQEEQSAPDFGAVLYDDRYRVLRAGLDWSHLAIASGTLISLGGELSQGISGLGSRSEKDASFERPLSRLGADDVFSKGEIQARLWQPLPYGFGLELSGRAQYAFSGPLLNGERFSLGGARALSALDDGELSGDHGWLVRAELSYAATILPGAYRRVSPYLFAARGQVENEHPSILEARVEGATNIGLGARASLPLDQPATGNRTLDVALEAARRFHDGQARADEWRFNLNGTVKF